MKQIQEVGRTNIEQTTFIDTAVCLLPLPEFTPLWHMRLLDFQLDQKIMTALSSTHLRLFGQAAPRTASPLPLFVSHWHPNKQRQRDYETLCLQWAFTCKGDLEDLRYIQWAVLKREPLVRIAVPLGQKWRPANLRPPETDPLNQQA